MIQSLGTIMRSSATVTVLTGVTVFVVGQLIAKDSLNLMYHSGNNWVGLLFCYCVSKPK